MNNEMLENLEGVWQEYGYYCRIKETIELVDVIIIKCEEYNPVGKDEEFTLMFSKQLKKNI